MQFFVPLCLRLCWLIMADHEMIISELLCFARKRLGNIPHVQLSTVLIDFYNETEVSDAKKEIV